MEDINIMEHYEIWGNDNSWTMTTSDKVQKLKNDGLIEEDAILIRGFYADSMVDANIIYDKAIKDHEAI